MEWYISTLGIYKIVFDEEPPTCAWNSPDSRFDPENFKWVYIRIIIYFLILIFVYFSYYFFDIANKNNILYISF